MISTTPVNTSLYILLQLAVLPKLKLGSSSHPLSWLDREQEVVMMATALGRFYVTEAEWLLLPQTQL
jgi:hypothetical protein